MKTRRRHRGQPALLCGTGLLWGMALLLLAPGPATAAHPFYERLLREGTLALERGEAATAARDLQVAAFGLLEEPPLLAEALTRLALARARTEDPTGFRRAFGRLSEIEERFGAYGEARLDPSERKALEDLARRLVPPELLARMPGFADLAQAREEPATETEAPPAADQPPGEAEPTAAAGERAVSEPISAPAEAKPEEPRPGPELTPGERSRIEEAREILASATHAQELERALELARPVADAHGGDRALQELVGEIAYRSSRWRDAVHYLERAELDGSRPELLFYLAVAQHETGRTGTARSTLERALPRLERTPFVNAYVQQIMSRGESADGAPDVP